MKNLILKSRTISVLLIIFFSNVSISFASPITMHNYEFVSETEFVGSVDRKFVADTTEFPFSNTFTTRKYNHSNSSTLSFTGDDTTATFSFDMNHLVSEMSKGGGNLSQLNSLFFTANVNTTYKITGYYTTESSKRLTAFMSGRFYKTAGGELFSSNQLSSNTIDESFVWGDSTTGGDRTSEESGSLSGNLIAGVTYIFQFKTRMDATENDTQTTSAIGNVTLSIGLPPENTINANAGDNLNINSFDQGYTIIEGSASDDINAELEYRWIESESVLQDWQSVGFNGEAQFFLSDILPLSIGEHVLTLEVRDTQSVSSDDMTLIIDNSPPFVVATGGGTFSLGDNIVLGGEVADFDGDTLIYKWSTGPFTLVEDVINTITGGYPVPLSEFDIIGGLNLGTHIITLDVSDGISTAVSSEITVNMVDTEAPTLQPISNKIFLWPPSHEMVDVSIIANADDNSGPVTLSASVASDEAPDTDADGNTIPDYTQPIIDQDTGIIYLQLRSERQGNGNGRSYSVTITATDSSGNSSVSIVKIVAPHNFSNK